MSAGGFLTYTRAMHILRDHSGSSDLNQRAGVKVGFVTERESFELDGIMKGTGFLEGGFYLQGEAPKVPTSQQASVFGGGFLLSVGELDEDGQRPFRDGDLELDERYKSVEIEGFSPWPIPRNRQIPAPQAGPDPAIDPVSDKISARNIGRPMPKRHPGILTAGTEELEQHTLFTPAWAGLLIADHRGDVDGPGHYSTAVADLTEDKIDRLRLAPLHTALRVEDSWAGNPAAALFFARRENGEEPDVGGGLFYSRQRRGTGLPILSYCSSDFLGPISPGTVDADKHTVGIRADGTLVTQGHFEAQAPIFLDARRDAPKEYDLFDYVEPTRSGIWTETVTRYDGLSTHPTYANGDQPGLFRLETRATAMIKDGDQPPPLGDPHIPPERLKNPPPVPEELLPPRRRDPEDEDVVFDPVEGRRRPAAPIDPLLEPPDTGVGEFEFDPETGEIRRVGVDFRSTPFVQRSHRLPQDELLRKRLGSYALSWLETVSPAHLGQPTPIGFPEKDYRSSASPSQEDVSALYDTRPFSFHTQAWGTFDDAGDPIYTQSPFDECRHHRPGSTQGGQHFMPPEVSLDHVFAGTVADIAQISTTYHSYQSEYAGPAWGTPTQDGRGMVNAISALQVGGKLRFYAHPSTGDADKTEVASIGVCGLASALRHSLTDSVTKGELTGPETLDSFNIPKDSLKAGTMVRIHADGRIQNTSGADTTVRLKATVQGQVIFDTGDLFLENGVNTSFSLDTGLTLYNEDPGDAIPQAGRHSIGDSYALTEDNQNTRTVNSGSVAAVTLTVEFGSAHANTSVTLRNHTIEIESKL